MKTYRVIARATEYWAIEVEAESAEEAMTRAGDIGGGDWDQLEDFDWAIVEAEEVKRTNS